jgi:hypothetical protein
MPVIHVCTLCSLATIDASLEQPDPPTAGFDSRLLADVEQSGCMMRGMPTPLLLHEQFSDINPDILMIYGRTVIDALMHFMQF